VTIRQRLLLTLLLLVAASTLVVEIAGRLLIERAIFSHSLESLVGDTAYLAADLETGWPAGSAEADAWADRAGSALGLRVTLIDAGGRVVGDSQVALSELPAVENHLDRPEVREAQRRETGVARRLSATLDRDMHYVARRVGPAGAPVGYVRVAAATDDLKAVGRAQRRTLTWISMTTFSALALIGYVAARRLTRSLRGLGEAAEAVAGGRLDERIAGGEGDHDEVGRLAAALERMRHALARRISEAESGQRLLAAILTGLREGILVVDGSRRVLLMNCALRDALHRTDDVPEGTPLVQVMWDNDVVSSFEEALSGGQEVRRRVTMPDGVSFELTVVRLEDVAGRGPGAIGLFFNVTRLDALERVRRDFVADISHELRTPLASMRASVETLEGGALSQPADARRFLEILSKNTVRMGAILDDLTDLSLIETGSIQLSPGPVDLAAAVNEAGSVVASRAAARRVSLRSEVPSGLRVRADRRRLDQILVNLLDNAVKFNRAEGSVRVHAVREGDHARLSVEDTGPGIPPQALDRIFNRFYRLDRSRSRDVPGTGLGLAIVKHLVRLQGGDIRAENLPGTGARFVLVLPLAEGR
jgi:two-component system, OmpR family, phosphate regulon sensor histidine kinase PhoR